MFEAFGEKAHRVIKVAEAEAKGLGHKLVGTEHILLSIAVNDDSATARLFRMYGINHEILRQDIIKLTGWGEKLDFGGSLIFDPSAKKAMEYAMEEMALGEREFIGVEHLFLGITKKIETIASILLEKRGQLRSRLREEIRCILESTKKREKITENVIVDEEYKREKEEPDFTRTVMEHIEQLEKKIAHIENTFVRSLRTGFGFDSHEMVEGRDLILGGVRIPYHMGLKGHSDADVLIHAIIDAILGALGAGDIGSHFPDNDDAYKDISSTLLLARCEEILESSGYRMGNLDSVVIAEKPRLSSFIEEMRENISSTLKVDSRVINIKAKTAEGMGYVGKGKGIASYASAIVYPGK